MAQTHDRRRFWIQAVFVWFALVLLAGYWIDPFGFGRRWTRISGDINCRPLRGILADLRKLGYPSTLRLTFDPVGKLNKGMVADVSTADLTSSVKLPSGKYNISIDLVFGRSAKFSDDDALAKDATRRPAKADWKR